MYYTNDPVADYNRYDADQQKELERFPKCAECGQPITDDGCYKINDQLICEECLDIYYRVNTDDFIE